MEKLKLDWIEFGIYFDMIHNCIIFEESIHMGSNSSDPAHTKYIRNRKSSIVNTCTSDDIPSHYGQVIKFWAKKIWYMFLHNKKSNVSKNVFSNIVMLMWKLFDQNFKV